MKKISCKYTGREKYFHKLVGSLISCTYNSCENDAKLITIRLYQVTSAHLIAGIEVPNSHFVILVDLASGSPH